MRQGASLRSFVNIHATHRHSHRGATPCDNAARCDIAPAAADATDRLATIDGAGRGS
jgi:F0F1-type ATP synthase assembly protein I